METPIFPLQLFQSDFQNVYEPAEDTFLLIDSLENDLEFIKSIKPFICLEVGCGSGAVITSLAKALGKTSCLYFATDINPMAVLTSQKCGAVNHIENVVNFVVCDLAKSFEDRLKFNVDLLIFNPPYVPTSNDQVVSNSLPSSWAGGLQGRQVMDRFLFNTLPTLLSPNGILYLITIKQNNINEISDQLKVMGFHMQIVLQRKCGIENLMAVRITR